MSRTSMTNSVNDPADRIQKLRSLNEELSNELKLVNQKLKESEAMKDHFVSNIRNEIINPFSSIIGLSKNIMQAHKEDWTRVITMVTMIHDEAFCLDLQLRNIFMAASIEAGIVTDLDVASATGMKIDSGVDHAVPSDADTL